MIGFKSSKSLNPAAVSVVINRKRPLENNTDYFKIPEYLLNSIDQQYGTRYGKLRPFTLPKKYLRHSTTSNTEATNPLSRHRA